MPFRPEHSLLRVEVPALHTIDTASVESLFGMWALFSKASNAIEDGKRLENLSWRLWNRETFCCAPESQARSLVSLRPKAAATSIPVPALSSSLDSAISDDFEDDETTSCPATCIPKAHPALRRVDSSSSSTSRGREKHITPIDLEKIVKSIQEEPIEFPMSAPTTKVTKVTGTPTACPSRSAPQKRLDLDQRTPLVEENATPHMEASRSTIDSFASTIDDTDASQSTELNRVVSEESSNTEMSTHSIVRGFNPSGAPSSYRSQTHLAVHAQPTPILKTSAQYQQAQGSVPKKKKGPMFTIGTSSGEEESSLETRYKSSSLLGVKRADGSDSSTVGKKKTSFQEEVAIGRAAADNALYSEEDDTEISESAIEDDDDSSDWEDSDEQQSGPSSIAENHLFQRVDSRPNLTSRRSLLTTLMHEPDRAKALQNAASRSSPALRRSRSSTPNGPSLATSPEPGTHLTLPGQSTHSKPIIMTTSNTHPQAQQRALSPRTTRRNMLSTELTESLRKNLLWERQHKSTGNLAAMMQRRHTSSSQQGDAGTAKLRQPPEPVALSHDDRTKTFTNEWFHAGLGEYHTKGW
ncbi:hypothetical protein LTR35_004313 [Friedmanniomyces endolithicus]|uniref:Nitrogen regulatory protein areA GATA-like domain-containing protein n=1 Tax=Friedmanniomyces endolithicus TaxID=329885 RepID=A0AAN6FY62_9PEZI|nr:hypothetical protein LTS00_013710 [Friedmanniomyces endolithicus]KAK0286844.1 hypothetical protein LTR35_004313 [Friedmanniomyces endolithicus]KAK0326598.1 hypothetical protein LTR82_002440 [Friedmanniomyces endolithicus]KAK1017550.1 hypothetical protein LTR54_002208 [Friedmanniomyces endolithicus]